MCEPCMALLWGPVGWSLGEARGPLCGHLGDMCATLHVRMLYGTCTCVLGVTPPHAHNVHFVLGPMSAPSDPEGMATQAPHNVVLFDTENGPRQRCSALCKCLRNC